MLIALGAIIIGNVCKANNFIVGASAIITKDVSDYSIVAGAPAKKTGDTRDLRK